MMASDQVDSEYRKFGATQGVSYLKVDIQQTLRRTLLGTNSDCDATTLTSMKKFRNLLTPQAQAQSNINLTSFTTTADLSIAHCFLRPESYPLMKSVCFWNG